MAPQPSPLRTSFRALCITRIEIKESVIYGGRHEGSLDHKSLRISKHAWASLRLFPLDDFYLRKASSKRRSLANKQRRIGCEKNQFDWNRRQDRAAVCRPANPSAL